MSAPTLGTIQQGITRYGMPMIVVISNLGNFCSILVFIRKRHRGSSCSIYLTFAAIFAIVSINWAVIPIIDALNHPPDPFSRSLVLCRLRGYILQLSNNLFRTFLTLACVDRFAISSSSIRIRGWANKRIAWRMATIAIFAWLLIPSHILIWQKIENSKCSVFGSYAIFYTTYTLIIIFTPLGLMSFFGFLTLRNMKQLNARVFSTDETAAASSRRRKKRDIDLLKMVLTEVIVYLLLTSAYPLVFLYTTVTANIINKSATSLQIESFISFISNSFLQYLNSGSPFFIYMATSRTFRSEVKKLIMIPCSHR